MDFRPNFYLPSQAKEGLAAKTSQNLQEIAAFERAITPDLAKTMTDITRTYPSLDKRLVVYGALSGLQADDDAMLKLAQTQEKAMEKKQRAKVNTQVNFFKRGTQLSFLAMDSAFQNISRNFKSSIVAAQETGTSLTGAVVGNTLAGLVPGEQLTENIRKATLGKEFNDKYEETKEAYGENEFRRALGEVQAGRPLNLGVGLLPNSLPLEETDVYVKQIKLGKTPTEAYEAAAEVYGRPITEEFERDEYENTYLTKYGERIPISPGRVVAAQFSREGDIKYALASTIIDGAFRLGADPINLLLGYGGAAKTAGRKIVSKAEVAQYVDDAAFMTRALKTFSPTKKGAEARRLTFGKTAEQIMDSKWGDKFVNALTENNSVSRLKDIPTLSKVDPKVLNLLAQVKDKQSMREIVLSLLKHGDLSDLMVAPYTGAFVGQEIAEAAIQTPLTKLPMRQSVVADMANELAKKFAGQSIDVAPLRNTIGALLGKMSDDPFRGVIGLGGSLKNAIPQKVKRYFDLAPSRFAAINYIGETIENIDSIMVTLGENQKTRDFYIGKLLTAKTQDDIVDVVKTVNKRIQNKVIKDNPDLQGEEDMVNAVIDFVNNEISEKRKYFYDKDGKPVAFPGTKYKYVPQSVDETGEIIEGINVAVPTAFSMGQFADNFTPLIDYRELGRALNSFRRLIGPSNSRFNKKIVKEVWSDPNRDLGEKILQYMKIPTRGLKTNYAKKKKTLAPTTWLEYIYSDYIMQRALKPMWMLRPALALRVPPEEAVRIAMYGGPNVFSHPLLLASLKSNFRQGDPTNVQLVSSLGEQLLSSRIDEDEIETTAELLGNIDMQKGLETLKYDDIQQIMKVMRLNTNVNGQVGDSFLQYAIDGNNATDFAFDEIVGELKQLKTQKVNPVGNLGNSLELRDTVRPFANLSGMQNNISVIPNKKYKQIVEVETNEELRQAIQNYANNPSIQMQLKKLNHGLSIQVKDNSVILDVTVQLNSGSTATEADTALKNALSIAVKSHQSKIYIRQEAFSLLPDSNPIKNSARYIEDGDVFEVRVYAQADPRIDNVDINTPVVKNVMEYLFNANFQTAKKIIDKKGGYAQAAPSGSFFNTDKHYIQTMSEQSLVKALKPTGKQISSAEDFYIMVDKYEPDGTINPQYWRGWIHDIINKAGDPLFVIVARDGADKAFDFFSNTTSGKKYIKELIARSDDPEIRSVLENSDDLLKYLKSTEYEIGRLQGNATRRILRDGQEITEEQARELLIDSSGKINFPDYEVDLSVGAAKVREFIANGGFIDGDDYLELAQKYSVLSAKTEKYFGEFYDKIKKVFDEDIRQLDLGPRVQAFNNNPYLTPAGQPIDTALSKLDDALGSGYSILLAKPSDYLNRDPMFRWSFYTLATDLIPFMTEEVKKEFIVGAKTWIDGSDLYDDILRLSKLPAEENSIVTLEQAETLLKYKAMDEVKNLLYASSDRHVLSDVMASYVPFPEIWQEVIKTWGKLLVENPQKFNRTRIGIDRGKEAKPWDTDNAFFTSDPVTGELLFNYVDVMHMMTFGLTAIPGAFGFAPLQTGLLGENLEDDGVRVRPYGFLEGLNLISANGFSPGFGPILTFPFKILTKIATVPKFISNFILGNFEAPGTTPNPIDELPAWAKGFFKAIPFTQEVTEEINASYAKSVMDIFTLYYYAGKWTPDDEQSIKVAMQEAERAAAVHWLVRGAAQAAFPTAIQPRYEVKDKNGAWWTIQVLGQKYQQMLEANQFDYYLTTQQFTQKFGMNPIPLRQSSTVKKGRFPVKKDSYAFWSLNENKELLARKPYTAIHLMPDRVDDEFSLPAFMAGGEVLDPNAYARAVNQSLLQFELENYKEELNADKTLTTKARNEMYSSYKAKKQDEYGVIAYGRLGDAVEQADKYQIIQELRDWKNEPLLRESPAFPPLQKFLKEYDRAIDVVLNGGTFRGVTIPTGGIPNKTAATLAGTSGNISSIRTELDAYARELALQYEDTEWISIYLSSFWKELDNRRYIK
tara:strand:- start:4644 stop:10661 length:6018 start_codon:yes stop_codon:yes gene_type:complete